MVDLPEIGTTVTCTCGMAECVLRYGIVIEASHDHGVASHFTVDGSKWITTRFGTVWWIAGVGQQIDWPDAILASYTKATLLGEVLDA